MRTTRFLVIVLLLALWLAGAALGAVSEQRPTEPVSPAPQINPNAVVWRTPQPPANPQAGDLWVNPKDEAEMVYVPAGEFLMGTNDARIEKLLEEHADVKREMFADERPQRQIYLDGFWMDKTEVTVGQYRSFCKATGRTMPEAPASGWQDNYPISGVTFEDAQAYAKWSGGRLPTQAEWEKAARGTDGREYPWGNKWDVSTIRRCNFADKNTNYEGSDKEADDGYAATAPVGSYTRGASPYGCVDMAGNVWEYCEDRYTRGFYEKAPARNPKGLLGLGVPGALRGGDCASDWWWTRSAKRYPPIILIILGGFRCAREPG